MAPGFFSSPFIQKYYIFQNRPRSCPDQPLVFSDAWRIQKLIHIDAIKTLNGIPGEVYKFVPDDFKETLHLSNIHDISFLTSLKLAKKLDIKTPENIYIIAIEIVEDMVFSDEFTPYIQEKYPKILEEVTGLFLEITKVV